MWPAKVKTDISLPPALQSFFLCTQSALQWWQLQGWERERCVLGGWHTCRGQKTQGNNMSVQPRSKTRQATFFWHTRIFWRHFLWTLPVKCANYSFHQDGIPLRWNYSVDFWTVFVHYFLKKHEWKIKSNQACKFVFLQRFRSEVWHHFQICLLNIRLRSHEIRQTTPPNNVTEWQDGKTKPHGHMLHYLQRKE